MIHGPSNVKFIRCYKIKHHGVVVTQRSKIHTKLRGNWTPGSKDNSAGFPYTYRQAFPHLLREKRWINCNANPTLTVNSTSQTQK